MKVSSKEAVKIAVDYFRQITGNYGVQLSPEEVDFDGSEQVWRVTLSFHDVTPFYPPSQKSEEKIIKIFEISSTNGEVYSMKNRRH